MNGTPRSLNRILLAVIGALALCAGAIAVALAAVPSSGWWARATDAVAGPIRTVLADTTLTGQKDSWLWIVVAFVLLVVIAVMIGWATSQGRGRGSTLVVDAGPLGSDANLGGSDANPGDPAADALRDATAGSVAISGAVPEQALRAALEGRPELVSASVSTYDVRSRRGLKVRVVPRQGVAPYDVAEEVLALVDALDEVLGIGTPVLVSIAGGARARFMRTERVR